MRHVHKHQNWALSKYAVINTLLLFIHDVLLSSKKLLNITNKIQITREANESILHAHECTLRYAHARVMCSECNCTKKIYTHATFAECTNLTLLIHKVQTEHSHSLHYWDLKRRIKNKLSSQIFSEQYFITIYIIYVDLDLIFNTTDWQKSGSFTFNSYNFFSFRRLSMFWL